MTIPRKILEGFWYSPQHPHFPKPQAGATPWEGQAVFLTRLRAVEALAMSTTYKGFSTCRLCGTPAGSREFFLSDVVWPDGLKHYIQAHNVKPSEGFRAFVSRVFEEGVNCQNYEEAKALSNRLSFENVPCVIIQNDEVIEGVFWQDFYLFKRSEGKLIIADSRDEVPVRAPCHVALTGPLFADAEDAVDNHYAPQISQIGDCHDRDA